MIGPFDSEPTHRSPRQRDAGLPCPECCGEGHIEVLGGPGYFDDQEECWMPSEELEMCSTCRGTGVLESEAPDGLDAITEPDPTRESAVEDAEPALPF